MTPAGFYTRDQVRDRLELTEREIRRLVAHNVLRTDSVNHAGWSLYSEGQLQTLLNRKRDGSLFQFDATKTVTRPASGNISAYNGEDGVRVFELIERKTPLPKIVMLTGLHPRIVDQIRFDYDQLSVSMTLPKEILDQINGLKRLQGSFPLRSPTDLLEVLLMANAERLCMTCKKQLCAAECPGCILKAGAAPASEEAAAAKTATNGAGANGASGHGEQRAGGEGAKARR